MRAWIKLTNSALPWVSKMYPIVQISAQGVPLDGLRMNSRGVTVNTRLNVR
jgi:hypothetical protein